MPVENRTPDRLKLQDLYMLTVGDGNPVIRMKNLKPKKANPQGRRDHEKAHDCQRYAGFLRRR